MRAAAQHEPTGENPREARDPLVTAGTKFGPYEILAPIGVGGMGEVYKAKDARLNRRVLAVFNADPEALRAAKESTRAQFEQALERYFADDPAGAAALFTECVKRAPGDRTAVNYLEIIRNGTR